MPIKKRLNVRSLASFPVASCQASLALLTLCLSYSMALRTTSSSVQSMIGLRPQPGRVCRPLMPSVWKRFTQKFTDMCNISVCKPMNLLEIPVDFIYSRKYFWPLYVAIQTEIMLQKHICQTLTHHSCTPHRTKASDVQNKAYSITIYNNLPNSYIQLSTQNELQSPLSPVEEAA